MIKMHKRFAKKKVCKEIISASCDYNEELNEHTATCKCAEDI